MNQARPGSPDVVDPATGPPTAARSLPRAENQRQGATSLRLLSWGVPALVVLVIALLALTTDNFLTTANITAVFRSAALTGIVAVAMTP